MEVRSWGYAEFLSSQRERWDRLCTNTQAPPDLSAAWCEALLPSQSIDKARVRVITVTEGSELIAVWPFIIMARRWHRLPATVVTPLGSLFTLHHGLLSAAPAERIVPLLMQEIERTEPHFTWLQLDRLVAESPLHTAWLAVAASRGARHRSSNGLTPPYLQIDCSWDEFLARKSANFRSNLKRKTKKISAAGRVHHEFISDPLALAERLRAVRAIEENSWKAAAGTAITSRPWEWEFYQRLVAQAGNGLDALLTLLTLDDQPVAYDLSVMGHGKAYCLKTSFDSRYAELSPGYVLRALLMQRIFELGLREYDFLGANERYKLEWSPTTRPEVSVQILNPRGASRIGLGILKGLLRRRSTNVPALHQSAAVSVNGDDFV